jgi:DnaJ-class molecular chaperone
VEAKPRRTVYVSMRKGRCALSPTGRLLPDWGVPCEDCRGEGSIWESGCFGGRERMCRTCWGNGRVEKRETATL